MAGPGRAERGEEAVGSGEGIAYGEGFRVVLGTGDGGGGGDGIDPQVEERGGRGGGDGGRRSEREKGEGEPEPTTEGGIEGVERGRGGSFGGPGVAEGEEAERG